MCKYVKHKENFQLSNQHELLHTKHLRELRIHDCVGIHSKDVTLDVWKFLSQQGRNITSFHDLPWRSRHRSQSFFPSEDMALVARDAIWGEGRARAAWPLTSIPEAPGVVAQDTLRGAWAHSRLPCSRMGAQVYSTYSQGPLLMLEASLYGPLTDCGGRGQGSPKEYKIPPKH